MSSRDEDRITFFAHGNFHDKRRVFGIRQADRLAHMYVIGKTGSGKSTLIETLVRQDIEAGNGLLLMDPHGDLVERVVAAIPAGRKKDLIYFNVPDRSSRLGFNPLEPADPPNKSLAVSGLLEVFKKIWSDSWGPRLEHVLRNALWALADQPAAERFFAAAHLVHEATSFGGVHTSGERRARWGADAVSEGFIRLSIGLEDVRDLIDDLTSALGHA